MAYTFNPTPGQAALLAQIRQQESGNDYQAYNPSPDSTASGAYQFVNKTWAEATAATGVPYYPTAGEAPQWVQDTNALWLLKNRGIAPWITSSPPGGYDTSLISGGADGALVDLNGAAASMPTPDIMSQLGTWASSAGIDVSSPATGILIALAVGAVAYFAFSRG